MALVSISEAAKLTGKSIKTIYRHLGTGKLSFVLNESGNKCVDISELIRIYGPIKKGNENIIESHMSQAENDKNNILRFEIEHLKQLINEKNKQISIYERTLTLLEDKTKEKPPISKKWWQWFK